MERLRFGRPFLTGLPGGSGKLSPLSEWDQENPVRVVFPPVAMKKKIKQPQRNMRIEWISPQCWQKLQLGWSPEVLCLQDRFCLFSFLVSATWTPFLLRYLNIQVQM